MYRRLSQILLLSAALAAPACQTKWPTSSGAQSAADAWLDAYTSQYQELVTAWYEAEWEANTRIVEGDDSRVLAAEEARKRYAEFTGSKQNIEGAQSMLQHKRKLTPVQVKQFERVLSLAASNPQTEPELTNELIEKEGRHIQALYAYEFMLDGKAVTTNDIDNLLRESADLAERQRAWEVSKGVGAELKHGLAELRDLRNGVVRSMGYDDFYSYQVSDYGLSASEMNAMMDDLNRELRPLFRELHTWARYELAAQYGVPVPDLLPAHWLPNRWAQDWSSLVDVEGIDVTAAIAGRNPEWVVKQGEDFYVSLGFPRLPQSFWDRSSLYPAPADADYKKNNHASAWHVDYDQDIRTLMSIEPNAEWYETVHHELGHIYYYVAYTNPMVPVLLREGANRAFHEAVGSQMGLAAMQKPFLAARGLVDANTQVDEVQLLLREALNIAVFMTFGAGTMPAFESALYADELPVDQFNAKWWELAAKYQGIAPPTARGEEFADGLSKTHIHDDPAQYYDYALSYVILFQLHEHIAKNILHQDPRATNYYGSQAVGDFLREILTVGATRDWNELLDETTGSELTAEPMLNYFEPLLEWLQQQNAGRTHTLPEL